MPKKTRRRTKTSTRKTPALKKSQSTTKKTTKKLAPRSSHFHPRSNSKKEVPLLLPPDSFPRRSWLVRCWEFIVLHKWLAIILIAAASVRLSFLDQLPWGLNRDEAALAYNGLLLSQTGQDEWGRTWPVTLESFGDYKLPGYPYLLALLFRYLPVNDFIVRLPSATAGVVLVAAAYGILYLLTQRRSRSLLAAAMVAFNPVFIWYARGAWEANLALALLVVAAWLAVWRARHRGWGVISLLLFFILLLASFFTYNSPWLMAVCLWPFLPWLGKHFRRSFWLPMWLVSLVAIVMAGLLLLPATAQKTGITIFTDATTHHNFLSWRETLSPQLQPLLGREKIYWLGLLASNFVQSFTPAFWLHGGSHPWHQLPGTGVWNWPTLILAYLGLAGIAFILADHVVKRRWKQLLIAEPQLRVLLLLLLALVPSIITVDTPHVTRSLIFFFLLAIIAANAFKHLQLRVRYYQPLWHQNIVRLRQWHFQSTLAVITVLVVALFGVNYWRGYQQTLRTINLYQGGLAEVLPANHEPTLIVNSQYSNRGYQYIQLAWETKMEPDFFYSTLVREAPDPMGLKGVSDLGAYHFYDEGLTPWDGWQVVAYNSQTQRWERQ